MSVPGKKVDNGTYEFHYNQKPEQLSAWVAFKLFVHDPIHGSYFGRTPQQWRTVGLFYLVFFSALAVFCAICMKGLLASLYDDRPKWILEGSLIGSNPGMGFRPISDIPEERSLIWYDAKNATQVKQWTNRLDRFLKPYANATFLVNEGRNQVVCTFTRYPNPGEACAVDVDSWGPCSSEHGYGFHHSAPCIFVKLNRIYGWVPEYYNDTNNLPKNMPQSLKDHIKTVNRTWLNTVWVSCEGENPHDNETIGQLEYYPESRGFPGYYFPFENTPDYLSPVVAVRFRRPKKEQIINVICRAWAKNIHHESAKGDKRGSVHFELMID